jgi:phosphonatase-like hydrolase
MASQEEKHPVELVVFDIAGTTVKNTDMVADAFLEALHADGLAITADKIQAWRGASKRQAIRRLIEEFGDGDRSEERVKKVYAEFHDRLREQFAVQGLCAIAGVENTFAWLRARGIRLALNTGFDRDLTDLILHAVGWDKQTVEAVVCGDEVPQGRPAPFMIFHAMENAGVVNVRNVATVGDTTLDLEAGWNAGVGYNIGVLSGAHGLQELQKAPHTHIITSVAAIPELWKHLS